MKIERFNTEQIEQLLASKRAQLEEEFPVLILAHQAVGHHLVHLALHVRHHDRSQGQEEIARNRSCRRRSLDAKRSSPVRPVPPEMTYMPKPVCMM